GHRFGSTLQRFDARPSQWRIDNCHSRAFRLTEIIGRIGGDGEDGRLRAFGDVVHHRNNGQSGGGGAGGDGDRLRHVAFGPAVISPFAGGAAELVVHGE